MSGVRIINRSRGTILGSRIQVAYTFWSRARGYIGRPQPAEGEGMLLVPCNAVHTFGMSFPLDLIFLDDAGRVLRSLPSVRPWEKPKRVPKARYVLEVPAGTIEATETTTGDELTWLPPRSPSTDSTARDTVGVQRWSEGDVP